MLKYALEHQKAIDSITKGRDCRKYELTDNEWMLLRQLSEILEVSPCLFGLDATIMYKPSPASAALGPRTCDNIFLSLNTKSCDSNPGHGLDSRQICRLSEKPENLSRNTLSCRSGQSHSQPVLFNHGHVGGL